MGAFSDWEREYDKEAYYKEEMRELNKEEELERLKVRIGGLVETFKALGFKVVTEDDSECEKGNPCGHCERCCE